MHTRLAAAQHRSNSFPPAQSSRQSTIMPETDKELWKLNYYHGLLPREDTVAMLKKNGDFLVRKSEENAGDKRSFVLSVIYRGQPKHYIFREAKGLLAVDHTLENGFKTIREFIEVHHRKKDAVCKGSNVVLGTGIGRKPWELAHATIEAGIKLGSGAFGIVRKGIYTKLNGEKVDVAIKEATLNKCTKEQIKEFMNEARIMRKFRHHNVIQFHGVAVGEEPLMIVMELATKGALKDYLKKTKRSEYAKLYMSMGAAAGLAHLHENDVIHCDIAARNCLFSENKVKIADFGLARELTKEKQSIKLGKNQRLPIKWLAPETMKERICTKKTDVWAFGILSWEIFENGEAPYAHIKNNNEVAQRVIAGERLKFSSEVHKEFADYVVREVWSANVDKRPSMQSIFEWMERNVNRMGAQQQTSIKDRSHKSNK